MIKIISHRGNINGPIPSKENRPSYIDCALQLGLDVEIDVRYIDNNFYLGHDTADYEISESWILKRKEHLWFHCKDLNSVQALNNLDPSIIKFCHTSDDFVLISNNTTWVHNLNLNLDSYCVIPLMTSLEIDMFFHVDKREVHGICTDHPFKLIKNDQ